jgi:hypothetical protein
MVVTAPLQMRIVDVVTVLDTQDQSCHPAVARAITSARIRFLVAAVHQSPVVAAVHQRPVVAAAHQKAVVAAVHQKAVVAPNLAEIQLARLVAM